MDITLMNRARSTAKRFLKSSIQKFTNEKNRYINGETSESEAIEKAVGRLYKSLCQIRDHWDMINVAGNDMAKLYAGVDSALIEFKKLVPFDNAYDAIGCGNILNTQGSEVLMHWKELTGSR